MTKIDSPSHPVVATGSVRARPLIGIPAPREQAQWRSWSREAHLLWTHYVDKLRHSGAVTVLLPVGTDPDLGYEEDEAAVVVSRLDGLLLAGGADVTPGLYGADPHPRSGPFDPARDAWEVALTRAALAADVPVLGICRGLQIANVALGGTLAQHLPDVIGSQEHQPVVGGFGNHRVTTEPGSWLQAAVGAELDVPTYHHQAVDVLCPGAAVTARAADGVIEAFEHLERSLIAVQWHPEVAESDDLFDHFVRLCSQGETPTLPRLELSSDQSSA
jgi:gamma-glutamyl-gamma-aminobutyrate hydrolase PuuD